MGGGICYQKHKERGAWFEVEAIKNIIISREARGEEASFERNLLKSWSKYKGWESAGDALRTLGKSKSSGVKSKSNGNLCPAHFVAMIYA